MQKGNEEELLLRLLDVQRTEWNHMVGIMKAQRELNRILGDAIEQIRSSIDVESLTSASTMERLDQIIRELSSKTAAGAGNRR